MKALAYKVLRDITNPRSAIQTTLLTALAGIVYLFRAFPYFINPQLYAEDGTLWLAKAINEGVSSVNFEPYAGFFHFPEKLFGFIVAQLPLKWAPALFALAAWALFIAVVYYLLSQRTKILTNNFERLFVVLCLCLVANFREFFFNFSNSIFLLGIIGVLILVAQRPKNIYCDITEKVVFVLACLCLPFAWFYVPIALFDRIKYKARNNFFLYAAIITAAAQGIGYLIVGINRSPVTLMSLFSKYTLLELYNQIVIPAIRFARLDITVAEYSIGKYPVLLVSLVMVSLLLATVLVLRKSKKQVWFLLFFLAGMTFAALKSPTLTVDSAIEAIKIMSTIPDGNRYFVFGILAVNVVFVKACYLILAPKFRYIVMSIFIAFGFLTSVHYLSFKVDKGWNDYSAQYNQGIEQYELHQNVDVTIPVNPRPWTMTIR